jgi:hypothetical protein
MSCNGTVEIRARLDSELTIDMIVGSEIPKSAADNFITLRYYYPAYLINA